MSIPGRKPVVVRRVFAQDLEHEIALICTAVSTYSFVSIDTEFPGTIFKLDQHLVRKSIPIVNYQYMKSNVDALKIIQLGLTLMDFEGNLPDFNTPFSYVWEFNFRDFDIHRDRCDRDSIELLKRQGIDFDKNREHGIDSADFAQTLVHSQLLFQFGQITWIAFHGAYDFAYMLKVLTQSPLPFDLMSFMNQLVYFFGYNVFDIKQTFRFLGLQGGLERVAQILKVHRVTGSSHQAGSDSLLTLQCFMKFKESNVFNCEDIQMNRILPRLALYGLVQTVL